MNALNDGARDAARRSAGSSGGRHRYLQRFIRAAGRTRICFVAFPIRDRVQDSGYAIDEGVFQTFAEFNVAWIDMRSVVSAQPSMWADPVHLSPAGREAFTPDLTRAVLSQLTGRDQSP